MRIKSIKNDSYSASVCQAFFDRDCTGPRGLDSGKLAKSIWQTAQKFGENRLSLEDIQDVRTMSDALYQTLQIGENTIICGSLSIQGAVQRFMSEAGEMEE